MLFRFFEFLTFDNKPIVLKTTHYVYLSNNMSIVNAKN